MLSLFFSPGCCCSITVQILDANFTNQVIKVLKLEVLLQLQTVFSEHLHVPAYTCPFVHMYPFTVCKPFCSRRTQDIRFALDNNQIWDRLCIRFSEKRPLAVTPIRSSSTSSITASPSPTLRVQRSKVSRGALFLQLHAILCSRTLQHWAELWPGAPSH